MSRRAVRLLPFLLAPTLLATGAVSEELPPCCARLIGSAGSGLPAATVAGSDPDAEAPWDIEERHAPGRELAFTTSAGTWMSLDVHPDGQRLVFDLAGDLYELPIAGGVARRLTEGAAWDCEPRYAPDGRSIVFTSDRSGNDNLWWMDADGARPRALTAETTVRVRDAAFTPDGEYVIARKRITDTSSIGTNELWMFHRLGGTGVALTKRAELGGVMEPAVSPDGRYVYFSMRPGRFAYNSDPNAGIWQIGRLDRGTGQLRPLTGEFGGAIRPTPSPDGKTLAILRRVRTKTVVELYDLATGARRALVDWLDRDQQEGFANNGLYPRMDWTPDGSSLVLTAGGKLWRVDAASGQRAEIPFTADVKAFLTEPVRPKRSPVHDEVQARLIRWPSISADGKRALFGALGRIYGMTLADGAVKELAVGKALDGARLYAPSFSPDGDFLTFVSWDDQAGGAVWVMPSRGPAPARRVSRLGPKFSNPTFSADSKEIVALRGSGAHLRATDLAGELWSDIVLLDVTRPGADEVIVTETTGVPAAVRPRLTADGRRVLFAEQEAADPLASEVGVLISVNRDGTDRKTVIKVANAVEVVLSPDGRWVAFLDGHHIWLSAVPAAGTPPVEIGAGTAATPGWRLSEVSGAWVEFSPDSEWVTFGHGPEIHRVSVAEAIGWEEAKQETARLAAEGDDDDSASDGDDDSASDGDDDDSAKEEDETPPSQVFPIVLKQPRAVPRGAIAITGATVVTMRGDEVLRGATVVTRDDRIVAVGLDGQVEIPADAHRLDGTGSTIIPGLIDVHAHLHFSAVDVLPAQEWKYLTNLAFGVTTVHDPSTFTENVFAFAELVETGAMWGPRVFSTGEILYGAGGSFRSDVQSRKDAARHLARMKQLGAISVKTYQQPRRDQRQWIVEEGRAQGLLVVPEGGGDLFNNMTMALDGHSSIEHALPVAPLYDDLLTIFGASGLGYSPTLLVTYGGPFGENYFYGLSEVWNHPRLQRFMPRAVLDPSSRRPAVSAPEGEWYHQDIARTAAELMRRGALVTLGAHGQLQGLGAHWELWALGGPGAMTPHEALRAATLNGATYLGMEADLGSIEAGKLADLVILSADPLADLHNSEQIRFVMKNGALLDGETLDRVWPQPAKRPTMSWEQAEAR